MKSNLLIGRGILGRCGNISRVERVEHVDASPVRPVSRWLKSFVMAAAVCLAVPMANAADSLTMADFNHSIKLQVAGYTGTETLVNFPVLVRVSETRIPGFFFADMSAKNVNGKAMGYDLAFFAEDGTRLEIDKDVWNIDTTVEPTGEQLVWVKLPQMKQGTKFFMCYNVDDGKYVTNDKPWGDYVGVWHLNETGGSGTTISDSTANGLNGKAYAGPITARALRQARSEVPAVSRKTTTTPTASSSMFSRIQPRRLKLKVLVRTSMHHSG